MRKRLPFLIVLLALAIPGLLIYLQVLEIPVEAGKTFHWYFNCVEAAVWLAAGIFVLARTRRRPLKLRQLGTVAAAAFFLFGASDLVEAWIGTGSYPWWLFAWKAICMVSLVLCLVLHARRGRHPAGSQDMQSDLDSSSGLPLSPGTLERIDAIFPVEDRSRVLQILAEQCGRNLPFCEDATPESAERIRFAVLKLSGGDLAELERTVAHAKMDWRDVLVRAGFAEDVSAHRRWHPPEEDR